MNIPAIEQQKNTPELTLPEELYLLAETMAEKAPNCAIFTLVEDLENYHGRYNGIMWPYEVDLIKNNIPDFEQEEKKDPLRVSVSCVTTKKLSQENQEIGTHKKLEIVCGAIGGWSYTLEMPIDGGTAPVVIAYLNRKKRSMRV